MKKLLTIIIIFSFCVGSTSPDLFSSISSARNGLRPQATAVHAKESIRPFSKSGPLDGLTILRFSHVYKGADGVGEYLRQLNNALLQRSEVTILQVYITDDTNSPDISIEKVGKGTLIKVKVSLKPGPDMSAKGIRRYQRIYNILQAWLAKMKILGFVLDHMLNSRLSVLLRRVPIVREYYNRSLNADGVRQRAWEIMNQKGIFKLYKPDLVMIHSIFLKDGFVFAEEVEKARKAQKRNIPILVQQHGNNSYFYNVVYKERTQAADMVATVSSIGIPPYILAKHVLLQDGIDVDFFSPNKAKPLLTGFREPMILLPARISPRKGCFDIIRIVSKILRNGKIKKIKVVFAGSEEAPVFKDRILRLAKKYKFSADIIFAGALSQEHLRDYYAACDVVVLPSENEGLPRVILEAEAMGKPVVAYDVGGVSEALVDFKTGYLVKRGDMSGFAKRVEELLLDKGKRESMGQSGVDFVTENYNLTALAGRHEDCYLKALCLSDHREHQGQAQLMPNSRARLAVEATKVERVFINAIASAA